MKKMFFAAALAVFALASCNKENGGNNTTNPEGKATVAEITVKQATTYTRSVSSAPTADEKKINDMTIYVFNNSNILENIVAFTAPEISAGAGTGTYTKQFTTTTGIHKFIVAANIPTASGVKPAAMPALGDVMADVEEKLINIANKTMDDVTKNSGAAHFFMTTNKTASADLVEEAISGVVPAANKVNLELGRGMAKVTVNISNSVNEPNGVLDRTNGNKIEFFVAGNPNKMHYFPVYSGTQLKTPFYAHEFKVTPSAPNHSSAGDYFPKIEAVDDYTTFASIWVATAMNNDTDATKPFAYAMENSNAVPAYGESTYALITGLYIPKVWGKWDSSTIVDETAPTTPTTFYRLGKESTAVPGTYTEYFMFKNGAYEVDVFSNINTMTDAEIATLTGTVSGTYKLVTYTGGRSFYGLWLADMSQSTSSARYCVERNDYFDIVINDINGPGSNTPIGVIPDPEKPIEKQTLIEATITIKNWNVVSQNGSIG